MTSAFSEVTDITYDGTGSRVTQKTLPNGNYETYTYDVRGRVEDIVLKNSGHTVLRKLEHTYDAVDNITEIVETRGSAVTKTFGYDDIDQLISEDWSTGYTADYEYDENGNRTKRTVASTVEDYFYDDGDKLTEIKIGGSVTKSYDYDMSGRRTEMTDGSGTTYYGYDLGDRLTSITRSGLTTNSFGYNGFDTRVSKTDSTGTTSYKRAGAGVTSSLLKSTISGTTTDYTPEISSTVSSTSTFMHSGLKNSDEQSGSGGTIAASLQYDAFGKQVSSSGTWVGAFKYGGAHGYQTDPDHGLKLLGHRYYEADTGRFLTRDPIKDGRNWYGYCGNEPVRHSDSDGQQVLGLGWEAGFIAPLASGEGGTTFVIDLGTGDYGFQYSGGAGHGLGGFLDAGPLISFSSAPLTEGSGGSLNTGGNFGAALGLEAGISNEILYNEDSSPYLDKPSWYIEFGGTSEGGGIFSRAHGNKTVIHGNIIRDWENAKKSVERMKKTVEDWWDGVLDRTEPLMPKREDWMRQLSNGW